MSALAEKRPICFNYALGIFAIALLLMWVIVVARILLFNPV